MDTDSFLKKIGHHSVNFNKIYRPFALNGFKPYINLENGDSPSEAKIVLGLEREVLEDKSMYDRFKIIIEKLGKKDFIRYFKILHLPDELVGDLIDFKKFNNQKNRKNMFADDYGIEIEDHHGLKIDVYFSHHNYLDKHEGKVDKDSFFDFFTESILKINLKNKN